jgi:hypothetical protein
MFFHDEWQVENRIFCPRIRTLYLCGSSRFGLEAEKGNKIRITNLKFVGLTLLKKVARFRYIKLWALGAS